MIITIEGPTGSGKSALALALAEALSTEIVSCDSRQIYTHMDVGTAKPAKDELCLVPHHLIDIINPDEAYNAGLFIRDASDAIKGIHAHGKIPVLCGGTGLYIRSLLEGLFTHEPIPAELRESLSARLEKEGALALYKELQDIDPTFAKNISQNDKQRILRGLEIYYHSGKPISSHWQDQKREARYTAFRILLNPPRKVLYDKINCRLQKMMETGLIEEISGLIEMGYSWDSPGLSSLGYREFRPFFETGESIESCAALAAQHHRNYAKRQCTWYRKVRFDLTLPTLSFRLSDILRVLEPLITDHTRGNQCKS